MTIEYDDENTVLLVPVGDKLRVRKVGLPFKQPTAPKRPDFSEDEIALMALLERDNPFGDDLEVKDNSSTVIVDNRERERTEQAFTADTKAMGIRGTTTLPSDVDVTLTTRTKDPFGNGGFTTSDNASEEDRPTATKENLPTINDIARQLHGFDHS